MAALLYPFGTTEGLRLHPKYAHLRAREPLARVRMPYGDPAWLVTAHADATTVLTDHRFSRAPGRDEPRMGPEPGQGGGLMVLDPPDHTALRDLLSGVASEAGVERVRLEAEAIAGDLAEKLRPGADLLREFAVPLTLATLAELFGVPAAERDQFAVWAGAIASTSTLPAETAGGHVARLRTALGRWRRPEAAGLLGGLAQAVDAGRLSAPEARGQSIGVLVVAIESTVAQLGNFVYTLATEGDGWRRLVESRVLIPAAVEELMRFVPLSRAAGAPRYATEDVPLDGGVVRAGEPVLVSLPAANRDERVFGDAEHLDLTREPNPHLGFGFGVHHCLGADPARMVLRAGLAALSAQRPGLRLATGDVSWAEATFVRRPEALPVVW
jgi:cytochrome P450